MRYTVIKPDSTEYEDSVLKNAERREADGGEREIRRQK
jgi:hypothetical protein